MYPFILEENLTKNRVFTIYNHGIVHAGRMDHFTMEEMLESLKDTVEIPEDYRTLYDCMNREISRELLEGEGFAVEEAADGDEAVEKLWQEGPGRYDLVLMDIQMPRMDGFTATRQIRKLPDPYFSSVPIVALTANAFEEDRKAALEAGMNGHVAKPIDMRELRRQLDQCF